MESSLWRMLVLEAIHYLRKGHVVLAFETLDRAVKLDDEEREDSHEK